MHSYFSAVSWLQRTGSLPCTVRARPPSFSRHMHVSSESRRQVVWPHRVTGLLTRNLTAHALASCALPCHGSAGEAHVIRVNHLSISVHVPSEGRHVSPRRGRPQESNVFPRLNASRIPRINAGPELTPGVRTITCETNSKEAAARQFGIELYGAGASSEK